jgi:hypothetical protein
MEYMAKIAQEMPAARAFFTSHPIWLRYFYFSLQNTEFCVCDSRDPWVKEKL